MAFLAPFSELFEKTIRINLIGTFNVIRLAAFVMEKGMRRIPRVTAG